MRCAVESGYQLEQVVQRDGKRTADWMKMEEGQEETGCRHGEIKTKIRMI